MKNKLLKKVGGITEYLRSRGVAVATGGSALMASPLAFAGGSGGFDPATVLAAIAAMLAAGILIYTAWTAGKWTLRAFGLIGGK
jgi:hypothetical protein